MRSEIFWNPEKPGFDAAFTRHGKEAATGPDSLPEPSNAPEPSREPQAMPQQEHREERREVERPTSSTDDRLLGVLAEALFDCDRARKALAALKTSALYDAERRQWNTSSGEPGGRRRAARTQLLGVLAEALFDRDAARASLAGLKASALYDREHGQWYDGITDSQAVESSAHSSDDQLLGVLAEALFDREAARAKLAGLKASPLYDSEHRRWNNGREGTQLLGVLAESLFDRDSAIATLAALRATDRTSRTAASRDYADALVLNVVAGALFGRQPRLDGHTIPSLATSFARTRPGRKRSRYASWL